MVSVRVRSVAGLTDCLHSRCLTPTFLPTLNFLSSTIFYFVVVKPKECRAYFVVLLFPTSTTKIKKSDS